MPKRPISADSHITEPPSLFIDYIEAKYKDTAPHVVDDPDRGEVYVIEGMKNSIPMSLVAAAGKDPSTLSTRGAKFEELHRGGWDPKARAADQDCDGVVAEIIYPSVGMVLCNHEDLDYKRACFDAYNRWLKDFCEGLPNRLFGMPQLVMETPEKGIEEVRKAKEMGFKGVMLPGEPGHEDYHHTDYDSFYEAVVEMEMPLSFHILTSKKDNLRDYRGPK
ncbi:MAG: amidohydrolase family protein, partial [Pseudomonadota bacterium]|nr:amidohydrolase family protein [Pseudomonadota bacterium]